MCVFSDTTIMVVDIFTENKTKYLKKMKLKTYL